MRFLLKGFAVLSLSSRAEARCLHLLPSLLSEASPASRVDKELLSKLRKQTGYTFANCSKALTKYGNDFDKAVAWLNEQAIKEGWLKANKLQSRQMAAGLIGVVSQGNVGLMLEVNCETDFVSRNKRFVDLVSSIAKICLDHVKSHIAKQGTLDAVTLKEVSASQGQTVSDLITAEVGSIGENIQARRAVYVIASHQQILSHYVHNAGIGYPEVDGCSVGKYAALTLLQGPGLSFYKPEYGVQLGQHIVGMNPKSIGIVSKDNLKTDLSSNQKVDDESRLLYQEFLLDNEVTVDQWLADKNLSVAGFWRFEVGEGCD